MKDSEGYYTFLESVLSKQTPSPAGVSSLLPCCGLPRRRHHHRQSVIHAEAEIAKQAKASAAKMINTKQCYVDKLRKLQNDCVSIVCVDDDNDAASVADGRVSFTKLTQPDETELTKPEISPGDTVAIPYFSGTTELPKHRSESRPRKP